MTEPRKNSKIINARKSDINGDGQSSPIERVKGIWLKFKRFAWDVGGIILLAISVMTVLAVISPKLAEGFVIQWWVEVLRHWFGWGILLVVVASGAVGLAMIRKRTGENSLIQWRKVFALEAAAFASLGILTLLGNQQLSRAEAGLDGGIVGWGLTELFRMFLAPIWTGFIFSIIFFIGLIYGLGLAEVLKTGMKRLLYGKHTPTKGDLFNDAAISVAPLQESEQTKQILYETKKRKTHISPQFRKQFKIENKDEEKATSQLPRDERLPPLDLLVGGKIALPDERHINQRAGLIEQTLAEFGIPAKVIDFQVGPTVTQFAVEPGFIEKPGSEDEEARLRKVRVSQIASLSRDLALALSAENLRIQAPVPGRSYIGIEVPNEHSAVVRLRPILETEAFYKIGSPLGIALGRDVSGKPVVADLAAMPHLLIAGTTGSGKSVCIASLTTCLAMNNSPEDLRLVMIDPKMVELVRFNGLPHIYGKVETDLERILGVLRWVVAEMDRRYILLEQSRSRNMDTYNRKMRRRKDGRVLPSIVVMIDELADLMMSAPDATEHSLVRLAQMARATGIHLVVATQRPSTDVVTGLIKANFPARMSFAVASSIDSRVILDTPGAETLLGKGDLLFLPPDIGSPLRAQGVIVTDQEVERVITYWRKLYPEEEIEAPPWEKMLEEEATLANKDDLLDNAIKLVMKTQKASTSMLQRRLRVGYPRAARLMDELEELGIVGPSQGGGRERVVLVEPEEDDDE